MFGKTKELWENYGLEFLAGLSLLIIFILFIYNLLVDKHGTYSSYRFPYPGNSSLGYYYPPSKYSHYIEDDLNHPDKKRSKLEAKAKIILENVFRKPFKTVRPDFLRNEVTDQNLEIDLYNEELKLGVEVNGDQHYKFIPYFHRNKEAFRNQRYRDEMKKVKCRDQGITLIEIPYKVGESGIKSYLLDKLRLEGYLV